MTKRKGPHNAARAAVLDEFRRPLVLIMDLLIINLSLYMAFMLRYDWNVPARVMVVYYWLVIWMPVIRISVFNAFDLYNWSFRYASVNEAVTLWKAVTVGTFILMALLFLGHQGFIGRSVLLIDYILCLAMMFGFRFLSRFGTHPEKAPPAGHVKKVLIIGAGAAGEIIARELLNAPVRHYTPIGFVDDDPRKRSLRIHGIKVLGAKQDIPNLINKHGVEEIIVAVPSASGRAIRDIISHCRKIDVKFKIVPGLHSILTGKVDIRSIRDVKAEDLLGREAVKIDSSQIRGFLESRNILVTGAGGSIGSELARQIAGYKPLVLILLDHNENDVYFLELELRRRYPDLGIRTFIGDVKDTEFLRHIFDAYEPRVVFHAAAHKHVPLMQENAAAAVKNNITATRRLVAEAGGHNVDSFVFISTDKAVNPTSVMGASKRIAEMLVQAEAGRGGTKFMAVRFGNVIGSSGSVVRLFKKQIEDGGPLTVTHPEVKRYFMTVREAVELVLQAGSMGAGGEIFILDMGEQIKITDLAKNLITLSGLEPDTDISIEFIGLRPGEKLHEDMFLDRERDIVTKNEKIYASPPVKIDSGRLDRDVRMLEQLAYGMDEKAVVDKIKEMVPFYADGGAR